LSIKFVLLAEEQQARQLRSALPPEMRAMFDAIQQSTLQQQRPSKQQQEPMSEPGIGEALRAPPVLPSTNVAQSNQNVSYSLVSCVSTTTTIYLTLSHTLLLVD
jgi:hypothetical protein